MLQCGHTFGTVLAWAALCLSMQLYGRQQPWRCNLVLNVSEHVLYAEAWRMQLTCASGRNLVCCWLYALLADVLDWYQCNLPKDSPDQQQHELEDVESGESVAGASRKHQQQHLLPKHGKHLQRKTVSA